MKDSDQVLNANQENITFHLQIPLSQKKIKAHSILVLRFKKKRKKKEGKQGRKMRYSLTYIQINTQYTLAMYIITYIAQNIN